ncbi:hypothetical protein DFQ30_008575 [Apophysomyces sp. BC1015]|nr:hypothetical protein DFQ30_008575 [Apophysomyces sp. BC1015]
MFPFKGAEDLAHGYLLDEKTIHVQRLGELDPIKPQQQPPSPPVFEGRGGTHKLAGLGCTDHSLPGTKTTIHEEPDEKEMEHEEKKREEDGQETTKETTAGIAPTGSVAPAGLSSSVERSLSVKKKNAGDGSKKTIPRPTPSRSSQSQRSIARPNKTSTTRLRKPSTIAAPRPRAPKLPESPKPAKGFENESDAERRVDSTVTSSSSPSVVSSTTSDDTTYEPATEDMSIKEELEKERAIVRVLQRQKEGTEKKSLYFATNSICYGPAISKDLDYFSQTVDELMVEKTALSQKLEAEKLTNQHKDEDLDLLLEKLKTSTDNARDQSVAVEQTKLELEAYQLQVSEEKQEFQFQLNRKDYEIEQLRSQLSQAQDQIRLLTSTMEQLIAAQVVIADEDRQSMKKSRPSTPTRPTGTSSPEPHHNQPSKYSDAAESSSIRSMTASPAPSLPLSTTHYNDFNTKLCGSMERTYSSSNGSSSGQEDDLDHQLMRLTKEKEKLQSHYSKIPLSGGGHQSRRRKEELEEMLDEVDSQLSKVKQKIKRS